MNFILNKALSAIIVYSFFTLGVCINTLYFLMRVTKKLKTDFVWKLNKIKGLIQF
jgi:hypothetical protein